MGTLPAKQQPQAAVVRPDGNPGRDAKLDALDALETALRRFFAARRIESDPDVVRDWLRGLMADGVKVSEAVEALLEFTIHSTDYPTVAGVRRYLPGALGLTLAERSLFAWGHVVRAVRQYGTGSGWDFADPAITAAVRACGGMRYFCDGDSGSLPFREKAFRAAYETIARTGVGDSRPLRGLDGPDCKIEKIACDNLPLQTDAAQRLIEHSATESPLTLPATRRQTIDVRK